MKKLLFLIFALFTLLNVKGQSTFLSLAQQNEDFVVFRESLQEGHSGLYYFIDKATFDQKCDSIQKTFQANARLEDYYLKLRYLITLLCHGHNGINLPTKGDVNYKMAVLDSTKLYLPFEFLIVNNQLIIKEDCSNEQMFDKYTVVKSINGVKSKDLLQKMLPYIPADGINQTFKYYKLYNYYYFHHLFQLFYPDKKGISIILESNKQNHTEHYIQLLKPRAIESNYFRKNKKNISYYNKQLEYNPNLPNQTGYLRVSSFYKGLIENFGQKYELFLDSIFTDIKAKGLQNLILDLRNNEGGGDGYDNILLSYIAPYQQKIRGIIQVPSRKFKYNKYAVDLTDDIKGFIENPLEFLRDDSTLYIKDKYVDMMTEGVNSTPKSTFLGKIIVLTNGGSFSASTHVIATLYKVRELSGRKIFFVGEDNGGDIYCNTICAGQGYPIILPNSSIRVDMPFLCFGELKKDYPQKKLPDYEVFDKITDLQANKDTILDFAIKKCIKK